MHDETSPPLSHTPWHAHTVLTIHLWDESDTSIEVEHPLPGQAILCITNEAQQWEVKLRCHGPRMRSLLKQVLTALDAAPLLDAEPTLPPDAPPTPDRTPLDPKRPFGVGRPRKATT
jgi:hypothetical protein